VNKFPNAPYKYIRKIEPRLYACEKFSLTKAEKHLNLKYDIRPLIICSCHK